MKKGVILSVLLCLIIISMLSFISANPYSYDDSMDLKYKIIDGKIIYGYGDGVKYETSLRPKGLNWSEWRDSDVEISKRKVVDKTWAEIEAEEKSKDDKESDNVFTNLINGISNFFLRLFGKEQVSEEVSENCGGCNE